VIADMHCHYPMHLLEHDESPHAATAGWLQNLADHLRAEALGIVAHLVNDPRLSAGWRVNLDGLVAGQVGLVCSVLYWPAGEFRLGTRPAGNAFEDLQGLFDRVESDLRQLDPTNQRHVIIGPGSGPVDDGRVNFVHCVEGGFNLGPDRDAIEGNVKWLADRGILYITVAHLFFQGVATNAPAIPAFTDWEYARIFREPHGVGLTDLGQDLVRAMYEHKVLVDISHMSERAIDDTFELIEALDRESGRAPTDYPVLATHVGMRSENRDTQVYNLTPSTVQRVRDRGGLVGVIMAQHQLGSTADATQSQATVARHLNAIAAACGGGFDSCAIGSDLDGFIKPTLAGLENAPDFKNVAGWIDAEFSAADAEKIRYQNAAELVRRVMTARP
jgi:microsomal dipeptidase-like Zn-dependent dipeptidase